MYSNNHIIYLLGGTTYPHAMVMFDYLNENITDLGTSAVPFVIIPIDFIQINSILFLRSSSGEYLNTFNTETQAFTIHYQNINITNPGNSLSATFNDGTNDYIVMHDVTGSTTDVQILNLSNNNG